MFFIIFLQVLDMTLDTHKTTVLNLISVSFLASCLKTKKTNKHNNNNNNNTNMSIDVHNLEFDM